MGARHWLVRHALRQTLASLAGIVSALGVLEVGLRPLATASLPPIAQPSEDSATSLVVTSRQLEEGIAEAHFSPAGARLTGNTSITGAESLVILGDSYVVAREVADGETMGSWIERLARSENHDLNVRQYGWRGASPAQYLLVASQVVSRWNPATVVVVLDGGDLGADALNRAFPRLRIAGNDSVEIITAPSKGDQAHVAHHYSTLATLLRIRSLQVLARAPKSLRSLVHAASETRGEEPTGAMIAALPALEVSALVKAFGSRLLIVYAADVRVTGGERTDASEARLMIACSSHRVRCISMRPMMVHARAQGHVARGFSTTTLGVGHLNAIGHELVGRTVWAAIRPGAAPLETQMAER